MVVLFSEAFLGGSLPDKLRPKCFFEKSVKDIFDIIDDTEASADSYETALKLGSKISKEKLADKIERDINIYLWKYAVRAFSY